MSEELSEKDLWLFPLFHYHQLKRASVLMCAKDGTLKSPWMSSGGVLTPSHRNMLRPLARMKAPPSERRSSEQRTAAGKASLFRSRLCCGTKVRVANLVILSVRRKIKTFVVN